MSGSSEDPAAADTGGSAPTTVELTPSLSLDLYAVAAHLDLDALRKLQLVLPFDVILQDPLVLRENPALASDDRFDVRWEPGLLDGPTSARFAVVDRDRTTGVVRPAAVWDAGRRRFVKGGEVLDVSRRDEPEFHQVNVWALLQYALAFYEGSFGLGRPIPWGFDGNRLTVLPHAGTGKNAFYERATKSLNFYQFGDDENRTYTCLSADIVYHEFAHAVLDGIRPHYLDSTSVETRAFHEFFGDISAILLSLRNTRFRQTIAEQTLGDLAAATNLSSFAEEFGRQARGRAFLRSAANSKTMSHVSNSTDAYTMSNVLTGTMYEILLAISKQYLEREHERHDSGATSRTPSAKRVFWNAIQRMQRMVIQPLDLLPPVDVTFRDYALAVLRAEQLADPIDPHDYVGLMLDVFVARGILDEEDRTALSEVRYLHRQEGLRSAYDIDDWSRSRPAAYRFLHDNREDLLIPLGADLVVADLYDTTKYGRAGHRLPHEVVLQYVWHEDVALDDTHTTPLRCGGTLVFDTRGNLRSWFRKPGASLADDEQTLGWPQRGDSRIRRAWHAEVAAGQQRRQALLDDIAARPDAFRSGASGS